MSLRRRLEEVLDTARSWVEPHQTLKNTVHRLLIEELGRRGAPATAREEIEKEVARILDRENALLSRDDRSRLITDIVNETLGYGPIDPLIRDPAITEVMVNGPNQVYVEQEGRIYPTGVRFRDDQHVMRIIEKIVAEVGRRVDESQPYVDARLPDGSRVNAIIPPLALNGPCLTIRKFSRDPYTDADLIRFGTMTPEMRDFLRASVQAKLNTLITGGTGAGKTTLLNVLSMFIPESERIITIEDAAELQLKQAHWVRLETRPPNIEGRGQVTQRDLVRNALRMRPDRIIVGEVRGAEALDMLQAMNTGHEGSLTTAHANSPRDGLARVETMVLMAGMELPSRAIREQMASAFHLLIHMARLSDGTRKIVKIAEITGMEGDVITMQDIVLYRQTGVTPDGQVVGAHAFTGIRPRFYDRFKTMGIDLPLEIFLG
ncbi:MAG: CpaF family protein [Armatimonadota bacterium]|nr:CpaF family protein [Armatimonadota bacterium]MDR7463312.1 CpaF family protein [Armatimonadota bacterium]MDR7468954.1 CpaF family protein [Armatimonadota bacterium]MDR7473999.1 CpaF family protein [Armatimonadota bacterium]MDR7537994.1 CpaF family protein [Armatimonadota bacterium]